MTEVSKERRDELRQCNHVPQPGELRALLDMADEKEKAEQDAHEQRLQFDRLFDEAFKIREQRDRYWDTLAEAKNELWRCRSDMAVMLIDDDGGISDESDQQRLADIEKAALACIDALESNHD